MAEKYDVIVVGAGHNGLMAAAYLAKAGLNVCTLEHNKTVGGGVTTEELTLPGFKHDVCSILHGFILPNPAIKNDELGLLSKFGLEYIRPENFVGVLFEDESVFSYHHDLDKTCESIATFSERDAEAYRRFHDWSIQMLDMLLMGMYNPTPSFGETAAMMDSSPEGRVLLRALMVSAWDIADEWFESDKMKVVMTRLAAEQMLNPFVKGTGFSLSIFIPLMHKYGVGMPVGGSGVLSEALVRCIEAHGGTIKVSSSVKEFKIAGDEVAGVVLAGGEEILASKAVVSCINVKQMFPDMVPGIKLPDGFQSGIKNLHHSGFMPFNQHIALNEAPKWKYGGPEFQDTPWLEYGHIDCDEYQKAFQDLDFGIPRDDLSISIVATKYDPTRAPEGKHTLYLYAFEPYDLKDGGPGRWDEIKQDVADSILEFWQGLSTNLDSDNILGRAIYSPLDYERHNPSFIKGDLAHFGCYNWQMSGNRPLPGWHKYRTPVKKLYMAGCSTHPGMGVVGGGRAGVQVVMEDLGIDFEDLVSG